MPFHSQARTTRSTSSLSGLGWGIAIGMVFSWLTKQLLPLNHKADLIGQFSILLCAFLGGILSIRTLWLLHHQARQDEARRLLLRTGAYLLLAWTPVLLYPTAWQVSQLPLMLLEQSVHEFMDDESPWIRMSEAAANPALPLENRSLAASLTYRNTGIRPAFRTEDGHMEVFLPSVNDERQRQEHLETTKNLTEIKLTLTQLRRSMNLMTLLTLLIFVLGHLGTVLAWICMHRRSVRAGKH